MAVVVTATLLNRTETKTSAFMDYQRMKTSRKDGYKI